MFGTSNPKLGRSGVPTGNSFPFGVPPPPVPSSNELQKQFNAKLQQIKEIIGQLKNKRSDQKGFNESVRNKLADFSKQLSTVIIPAVRNLKSQIENLRKKCNQIDKNVEKIQNET